MQINPDTPSPRTLVCGTHDSEGAVLPAATLLARFQAEFCLESASIDPMDPTIRSRIEQYTMLVQAALVERLSNFLYCPGERDPEELKLIRIFLTSLSTQERSAARRGREESAKARESSDSQHHPRDATPAATNSVSARTESLVPVPDSEPINESPPSLPDLPEPSLSASSASLLRDAATYRWWETLPGGPRSASRSDHSEPLTLNVNPQFQTYHRT